MKRNRIIKIAIMILFVALIIVAVCFFWRKHVLEEERLLRQAYGKQNLAFPRTSGEKYEYGYLGFDVIDEEELHVRLKAYCNAMEVNGKDNVLTVTDIKEYLESEYNSDGSLRISSGYDHVKHYVEWYFWVGREEVKEYWHQLDLIAARLYVDNKNLEIVMPRYMSMEQLQELIKKYEDPSYEIDVDLFGEKNQ